MFGCCFLRNPIVHFMVSGQLSKVCFTSSLSMCNGIFLSLFSNLNFHASANIIGIPCLSLLGHHSVYDLLHHLQFMSQYSGNKLFSKIFARGVWYCPVGRSHLRKGRRECVQPDFAHFVSIFMFGIFGRLVNVSVVSLLMLWCYSLLSLHCQGNEQNSHTHAKLWPLGRNSTLHVFLSNFALSHMAFPLDTTSMHSLTTTAVKPIYWSSFPECCIRPEDGILQCSFELWNIFTY